jgi:hypothetical protein
MGSSGVYEYQCWALEYYPPPPKPGQDLLGDSPSMPHSRGYPRHKRLLSWLFLCQGLAGWGRLLGSQCKGKEIQGFPPGGM